MTGLDELFQGIESHRFSALVNVASALKTFLRTVEAQPEVQELAALMQSPPVRTAVCERAIKLAKSEADPTYEHPADAALAAYVWLLSGHDEELTRIAAAVQSCPKVWWAKKVAEKVLTSRNGPSAAGLSEAELQRHEVGEA